MYDFIKFILLIAMTFGFSVDAYPSSYQALAIIPNTATGNSNISGAYFKALTFTTPTNYTQVETIKLGLNNFTGNTSATSVVQLTLFSVGNDGKPATILASTSETVPINGSNLIYTFTINGWILSPNTSYALAVSSDNAGIAWWRGAGVPVGYNGFSYNTFYVSSTGSSGPWTTPSSFGNAVEILVSTAYPVPTLSITNTPQTYTGSPISAAVSCQGGGAVGNVQYNGSLTVPTNAATYAVTANCAASTNYSALTNASAGNFVISAAAPTLSISNTPQTFTSSPIAATVSCSSGGAVSNIKYGGNSTVPTNAGTYAVTANCAAIANYSASTDAAAGSFVISPATQATLIVVSTPSSLNVNTSSSLSTTGGSGNGAVTYSLVSGPCTLPVGTAILTGTGAGSCVVTATKAADANYNAIASAPVTVTVAGPPPVLNLVATPGPGYIRLDFSSSTPALAAATSTVQPSSSVIYTGTCVSSDGGTTASATGPNSPLTVTGVTAGKLYTCTVTGTDGSGSSAPSNPSNAVTPLPPASPTKPIPTLSEWAQILMMLMMIATAGFYGWRMKQR